MFDAMEVERELRRERAIKFMQHRHPCLVNVSEELLERLVDFADEELERFVRSCVEKLSQ